MKLSQKLFSHSVNGLKSDITVYCHNLSDIIFISWFPGTNGHVYKQRQRLSLKFFSKLSISLISYLVWLMFQQTFLILLILNDQLHVSYVDLKAANIITLQNAILWLQMISSIFVHNYSFLDRPVYNL